jgi:hypothetical protein
MYVYILCIVITAVSVTSVITTIEVAVIIVVSEELYIDVSLLVKAETLRHT